MRGWQTVVAALMLTSCTAQVQAQGTSAGAPCFHKVRNVTAQCQPLSACPSGLLELQKNMYPQLCGWPRGSMVPEVCCWGLDRVQGHPSMSCEQYLQAANSASSANGDGDGLFVFSSDDAPAPRPAAGSVARRKCREYVQFVCSEGPAAALMVQATEVLDRCHYKVELISGGKVADPMEFPHMALLGFGERQRIEFGCGGSLISPRFVLTAAHCKDSRSNGPVRWVLLGAQTRSQLAQVGASLDSQARPQLLQVDQIVVHPDYRPHLRYNDVALLRLSGTVQLGDDVRPACLHTSADGEVAGVTAIATGWGATGDAEDPSERLLKVTLPIASMESCRLSMNKSSDRRLTRGILATQMCAGGESIKDTCPGDSGGPLQIPTNDDPYCMYRVVGVVSFGPPCGIGLPGVYSRVSAFVPWLESVVWPGEA